MKRRRICSRKRTQFREFTPEDNSNKLKQSQGLVMENRRMICSTHRQLGGEGKKRKLHQEQEYPAENVKVKKRRIYPLTKRPQFRKFTPEEEMIYYNKLEESQGFDIPELPEGILANGMVIPVDIKNDAGDRKHPSNLAKLGLAYYNAQNGTNYEFVELIKANDEFAGATTSYITFRAKEDGAASPPKNFQTRVVHFMDEIQVDFCRFEKTKTTQNKKKISTQGDDDDDDDVNGKVIYFCKRKGKRYRKFTPEEQRIYDKKCNQSQGFDVGEVPDDVWMLNLVRPVDLKKYPCKEKYYSHLAKLGLAEYNAKNGTKYEFVELIRVNVEDIDGFLVYLTFQAKDAGASSPPKSFQTRLYTHHLVKTLVELCRVEET